MSTLTAKNKTKQNVDDHNHFVTIVDEKEGVTWLNNHATPTSVTARFRSNVFQMFGNDEGGLSRELLQHST